MARLLCLAALLLLASFASARRLSGGWGTTTATTDADILLELKSQFKNGDEVLPDWKGTDPCAKVSGGAMWSHITCDSGLTMVYGIDLNNLGLEGEFPEEGYALPPALMVFNLGNNSITGAVAANWSLPVEDDINPGLEELYLHNNSLSGPLPPLVLPESVTHFWLCDNTIDGPLPEDWVMPALLEEFLLHNNELNGTMPDLDSWVLPTDTEFTLTLYNNSFSGTIPVWPTADHVTEKGTVYERSSIYLFPGNDELCGKVPDKPMYYRYSPDGPSEEMSGLEGPDCPST